MENILGAILGQIDPRSLEVISRQANVTPDKAKNALASAIPILMNALAKNSSTPEGAAALQNAVARDHNGSLLNNLGALLGNQEVISDGAGILNHVLGNQRQNVEQYISKDAGLSSASVGKILEMAAPILMGFLGKKSSGGVNTSIIGELLKTYLKVEKKQSPQSQSVINQILDRNNDGNVMDDIADLGMSFLGRMMKK